MSPTWPIRAALLTLAVLAAGCSATNPEQIGATVPDRPVGEQVLRIAVVGLERIEPDDITPESAELTLAVDLMYDSLTDFDRAIGVVTEGVADGWSTDDGVTWQFTLDPARQFSDGRPLTSADVVASLTHAAFQGASSAAGANLGVIAGVKELRAGEATSISGLTTDGDHAVQVVVDQANYELPALLANPSLAIRPATVFGADGSVVESTVGSGPYRLEGSGTGGIVLERLTSGFGLQRVEFRRAESPEAGLEMLAERTVDVARHVSGSKLTRRASFVSVPSGVAYLAMNTVDGSTASQEARAALAVATDRASLTREFFGREVAAVNSLVPGGWWAPAGCEVSCNYSADSAVLAAARLWPEGSAPIVLDSEESAVGSALADLLQTQYEAVGIDVQQRRMPAEEMSLRIIAGDSQVAVLGSFSSVPSPAPTLWNVFSSMGRSNVGGLQSTGIDEALRAALATPDTAARREAFKNAEKLAMLAVPVIPLVSIGALFEMSDDVLGVDPILGILLDAQSVSIRNG